MWPWSTIRRLKDELAGARNANAILTKERDVWKGHWEREREQYKNAVIAYNDQRRLANERGDQIVKLHDQLAEALKNDNRDPKTGRFAKAQHV